MKSIAILIAVLLFGTTANAQEEKLAQVSFIYPIGTAGTDAINYSNKGSLNIIGGINGGVNGFELGSVFNVNNGDVNGGQVSGVLNYTTGSSNGFILSGVANVTQESSKGIMLSGVANMSESHSGAALAGIANLSKDTTTGAAVSGIINANGSHSGIALAGVANTSLNSSTGLMASGAVNVSGSHSGLQLSTINVAYKELNGAQFGVINFANKAKGTQFGVINIANSADSILPIGLINVVKGGYFAFELSTNELLLSNFAYKMGVEKFYTTFRIGAGIGPSENHLSTGIGFGSIIPIRDKHNINIELISDRLIYDNYWEDLNLLNQLNVNYQYQIADFLSIKAGPSFKNYVTNQTVNGEFNTIEVPYTIFERTGANVKTSSWLGFDAGIVISL